MPQYQSHKLKLLAVSAPTRLPNLPNVPTLKEAGLDFVRFGWLGICTAQGTPQPIIDRLNRETSEIVAMREYKTLIEDAGEIALSSTPAELGRIITGTLDDVAATIQEFGLQLQ
jgi:tripartite-type tricarboxylate transporter receptor subunit TctC